MHFVARLSFAALLLAALWSCGCVSKSRARAEARIAFLEGQQEAQARALDARRTSIRIIGNVKFPEITWPEGGTSLLQTLAAAQYQGRDNPRDIVIVRQRGKFPVDPEALLRGEDQPLEPGDTIEIHP